MPGVSFPALMDGSVFGTFLSVIMQCMHICVMYMGEIPSPAQLILPPMKMSLFNLFPQVLL